MRQSIDMLELHRSWTCLEGQKWYCRIVWLLQDVGEELCMSHAEES